MITKNFVGVPFIVAFDPLLPPLVSLVVSSHTLVWAFASMIAAVPIVCLTAPYPAQRRAITGVGLPRPLMLVVAGFWLVVAVLIANAAVPAFRGPELFAISITGFLALGMWAFIRRTNSC